jgi:hypothetical protein
MSIFAGVVVVASVLDKLGLGHFIDVDKGEADSKTD